MDDDYFEQEYEDELEALRDLEMEEQASTLGSKRSLFVKSTPKRTADSLNDSFPTELDQTISLYDEATPGKQNKLDSSAEPLSNSTHEETGGKAKKRRVSVTIDYELDEPDDNVVRLAEETSVRRKTSRYSKVATENLTHSNIVVTPKGSSEQRGRVLRRIPGGEYIPVTATNGAKSGYMSVVGVAATEQEGDNSRHTRSAKAAPASSRSLLGTDFQSLKQQVDQRRRKEALDALDRLKEISVNIDIDELDDDNEAGDQIQAKQNQRLWVDMYSPKLYIDLMSDEAVNRVLLRWVKMWDYVVFNKQRPVKKTAKSSSVKEVKDTIGKGNKMNNKQSYQEFMKKKYEDLGLEEDFDTLYRPVQKVVLLCGKPGLGKTTLAHVVAAHAGYNVIEMNASDERTAQSFRDKIEDSLTMKPLLGGKDSRPNCLIIDEIDGAPAPAINALLSKITDSSGTSEAKKKKTTQTSALLRPIICICNDLYAPALRSLKQQALVLNFPSQCPSKLATRLLEICRHEDLGTDMSTLMALCKRSSCDIRSCLNTLQFIRRRRGELTMRSLMGLAIGAKDEQKSLFSFWQQVFRTPSSSRSTMMPSIYDEPMETAETEDNSLSGRVERIYREAQACGEFNRLVQGLHENFPNMKYKDCYMRSINNGMDWLCFTDQVNQRIFSQQAFNLYSYLPYLSVVFHLNFSQNNPPKITYPKVQYEATSRQNHLSSLVTTLCQNVLPQVGQVINRSVLTMDILPLFVDIIIQPNMRPVNIQLYSAAEKAMLREMVSSMVDYNLTYTQHKTSEGAYAYTLEPPVDELIRFPDTKLTRKTLSYTAKQLIANEVQLERQRRLDSRSSNLNAANEASTPRSTPSSTPASKATNKQAVKVAGSTPSRTKTSLSDMLTPNHKQKLVPKNVTPSQKGPTDFFGRVIEKGSKMLSPESIQAERDTALLHTDIWYKFKEGFSNAVRKKVTITDLL